MAKTMTKYQLDHFRDKVKRNFEPLIKEQELLVKQYKVEATNKIVTSSVCQVIAFWKKYLSKTNSTITRIESSKANTAKAPHAWAV